MFSEKDVCFSQKHFMKFLLFQINVIILQSKASTEKRNTVLPIKQNFDRSQTDNSHFGLTQVRFSQKHFMKLYTLK